MEQEGPIVRKGNKMASSWTKVSDEMLLQALKVTGCRYAEAARYIGYTYGIKITRQAVWERAKNFPEEVEQMIEINLDDAEWRLKQLMDDPDPRVAFQAVKLYLTTIGRRRGYSIHQEIDHTSGGSPIQQMAPIYLGLPPSSKKDEEE